MKRPFKRFHDRLEVAIGAARANGCCLAVLLIDLDRLQARE